MRDLNDLCYFAAAIDHGGFSAASRALGLPKSTLSRRIAALEERLAVRLLHRSTRRLVVTEVGRQFHAHWQAILVEADAADAVAASTHVEPCGRLHVSCPVALLHWQVAEMLSEFAARHPQVELQISALPSTGRWIQLPKTSTSPCACVPSPYPTAIWSCVAWVKARSVWSPVRH